LTGIQDEQIALVTDRREERNHRAERHADHESLWRLAASQTASPALHRAMKARHRLGAGVAALNLVFACGNHDGSVKK
jgi:hypothetical protein